MIPAKIAAELSTDIPTPVSRVLRYACRPVFGIARSVSAARWPNHAVTIYQLRSTAGIAPAWRRYAQPESPERNPRRLFADRAEQFAIGVLPEPQE